MKDCAKKNRSNKAGEINGNAKLSADDVRFIRAQPRKPFVCHELAEKFGVAHLTIRHIRGDRRKWKSV
jgi:hypothetical protein